MDRVADNVVTFTGSTRAGRTVRARCADAGIPRQTELGGSNVTLVLPHVDPATAACDLVASAYGFAGQKCTATSRIVLAGATADVPDALLDALSGTAPGDSPDPGMTVGPSISASRSPNSAAPCSSQQTRTAPCMPQHRG